MCDGASVTIASTKYLDFNDVIVFYICAKSKAHKDVF